MQVLQASGLQFVEQGLNYRMGWREIPSRCPALLESYTRLLESHTALLGGYTTLLDGNTTLLEGGTVPC